MVTSFADNSVLEATSMLKAFCDVLKLHSRAAQQHAESES